MDRRDFLTLGAKAGVVAAGIAIVGKVAADTKQDKAPYGMIYQHDIDMSCPIKEPLINEMGRK